MIQNNFHTHTARCGHAKGLDEEYVFKAIQGGIKTLGFSDHAPYHTDCSRERMALEDYPNYVNSILELKEKYQKQITIYLGLEIENFQNELSLLNKYRKQLDYLIIGQHNLELDGKYTLNLTTRNELYEYYRLIEQACALNLVDCIAHPDYCLWDYPYIDDTVYTIAQKFAQLSLAYDIPLELNCGSGVHKGIRHYEDFDRYAYPTRAFFSVFAKYHCPIMIGLDVHNPDDFLTDTYLNRSKSVVEGLDLNILDGSDFIQSATKRKQQFLKNA